MTLGRYTLTGILGEGGMATVFAADDAKLGRQVAVKVMFPHLARKAESVARFKREARAAAGLDHAHILRVFDVGGGEVEDGRLIPPYIVLELVDGKSLSEFFEERSKPLAEVVAAIGVGLCHALTQAHAQNIVHRDIKPANVMVTSKGRLALADFGVAHMDEEDSLVTRTGTILGTPAFMSPEQALSDPVDSRSDVYSLGATLYSIATGKLPYSGTSAHILASILAGKCKPIEELNPSMGRELSRVIEKMMHIDADERTPSAQAAAQALEAVVKGGGFDDPEALLVSFLTEPEQQVVERQKTVISATLMRARKVADEGRMPMALSLADRVLCLDSENLQAQTLSEKYGRQRSKRIWPAVVLPMVVTAFVGILFWGSRPGSIAEYVDTDDAGPIAQAAPTHDAASLALTPLIVGELDAGLPDAGARPDAKTRGPKVVRVRPPDRAVKTVDAGLAPLRVADAAANIVAPPLEPARFIADIKPWCVVSVGGVELGRASSSKVFSLPAGKHKIECKQSTGLSWSKEVTLIAGQTKRFTGSVLAEIMVKIRLGEGRRAKIGGKTVANGASLRLSAGRHAVEILKDGERQRQHCLSESQTKLHTSKPRQARLFCQLKAFATAMSQFATFSQDRPQKNVRLSPLEGGSGVATRIPELMRIVTTMLGLWFLTALGSGCFYTEAINERPTPGIRVIGNEGPYFVGDQVRFDATKSVDDSREGLRGDWLALTCPEDGECTRIGQPVGRSLEGPFVVTIESHDTIKVQLHVTDAQGATRTQADIFTIVVGNKAPELAVQSTGHREAPGQPFVLHRGINLVATPSLGESVGFDPDGDEVVLEWQLLPPPGSKSWVRTFEPAGDNGYLLVPDVEGEWEIVVTADDGYGERTEISEKVIVGADGPPCLQGMDPLAIDDAYYLVDSADGARRFSVLSVQDALDPFPAALDSDPVLGQAAFRWFLKAPGAADYAPLSGFSEADYLVDPDTYNPGDQLQLRVEVNDRVQGAERTLPCAEEVWSCALETGSGCNQRMTWGVEIR